MPEDRRPGRLLPVRSRTGPLATIAILEDGWHIQLKKGPTSPATSDSTGAYCLSGERRCVFSVQMTKEYLIASAAKGKKSTEPGIRMSLQLALDPQSAYLDKVSMEDINSFAPSVGASAAPPV